jgi:hypothetical protein
MPSELKVELLPNGGIKLDARKMQGTTQEILKELEELAKEMGGTLEVERHVPGLHHHTHDHDHVHGGHK